MTVNIGRKTKFGIGREEASYGVLSTQIVGIPQNSDISVAETVNFIQNTSALGVIEEVNAKKIASRMTELTLQMKVGADTIGQFLYAAFGTLVTSVDTPESGANTHDFTLNQSNEAISHSIVWKDGNQNKQVLGAVLSTLEINVVSEEWVTLSATFMGQPMVTSTEDPTFAVEQEFCSTNTQFKFAANLAGLSGASAIPFTSFSLSFARNVETHYVVGSTSPNKIINKQFNLTGSGTLLFEDETYRDLFLAGTEQAIEVLLSDGTIPTTSTPYSIKFTLPKAYLETHDLSLPLNEKVEQSFDFVGMYDQSQPTPYLIEGELINDKANAVY